MNYKTLTMNVLTIAAGVVLGSLIISKLNVPKAS